MEFKKIKKGATGLLAACVMTLGFSTVAMAASESLNGGGATWYGGENADGILYSKLWDRKSDGIVYSVTVWVTDDKGTTSQKSGTTSGVDAAGEVKVTRASTHSNPFVPERTGYKDFVAKSAN
ncbi:hypothetical protein [Bacillus sp. CGMCC 1.16541]|uniref:hypothetical protein n=1 Tax=Bacillus sp. CGMCC 1.16541 TaxID=2185143 RepID=UPI000D72B73D|nr:hypothetical protein [Bacillus sp. CGMCC 1.16541]